MYSYGFLSRGFTDRREILRGVLVASHTGLFLFWGVAPGLAEFWASTRRILAGYASCWSTCLLIICVAENFWSSLECRGFHRPTTSMQTSWLHCWKWRTKNFSRSSVKVWYQLSTPLPTAECSVIQFLTVDYFALNLVNEICLHSYKWRNVNTAKRMTFFNSVASSILTLQRAVASDDYISECSVPSRSNLHF